MGKASLDVPFLPWPGGFTDVQLVGLALASADLVLLRGKPGLPSDAAAGWASRHQGKPPTPQRAVSTSFWDLAFDVVVVFLGGGCSFGCSGH